MERGLADITAAASLDYTGGTLRLSRIVPARLRYTAANITVSRSTQTTTAAEVPELDRLTFADMLPGESPMSFQRRATLWQSTMQAIEDAFTAINQRVDEVAILARLEAAETLAQTAKDEATTAKSTADQTATATQETFTQVDPAYADYFYERFYYEY